MFPRKKKLMMKEKRERDEKQAKKFQLPMRRRMCRFCADKNLRVDYKDAKLLGPFLSERARLIPRRISGNCAKHQRDITVAVKRARILALIPFTTSQVPVSI